MNQTILKEAEHYVKELLQNDASGHDWWHIYRVKELAKQLAEAEKADPFICELAALLHDVIDDKLPPEIRNSVRDVKCWLIEHGVDDQQIDHIIEIITTLSFRGGRGEPMKTLEGRVVQDADRLDAIGAVGIARTFAYAGWKGDLIYDPSISTRMDMTVEEYRNGKSTAINHFYEKLLKLKDRMNTIAGKTLAEERHQFMEDFLKQFYKEWPAK